MPKLFVKAGRLFAIVLTVGFSSAAIADDIYNQVCGFEASKAGQTVFKYQISQPCSNCTYRMGDGSIRRFTSRLDIPGFTFYSRSSFGRRGGNSREFNFRTTDKRKIVHVIGQQSYYIGGAINYTGVPTEPFDGVGLMNFEPVGHKSGRVGWLTTTFEIEGDPETKYKFYCHLVIGSEPIQSAQGVDSSGRSLPVQWGPVQSY